MDIILRVFAHELSTDTQIEGDFHQSRVPVKKEEIELDLDGMGPEIVRVTRVIHHARRLHCSRTGNPDRSQLISNRSATGLETQYAATIWVEYSHGGNQDILRREVIER